jgi:hypothetical protein
LFVAKDLERRSLYYSLEKGMSKIMMMTDAIMINERRKFWLLQRTVKGDHSDPL